ncbi:MAG TPA: LuxR family transcriptional regulator [Rhodospirillaceae bacterium]|nr:LuxR family transcriptional regulator [Rhodospirillaceae bacterium]
MLVDSHCHLDFPDFATEGADKIVQRATERGVGYMQTICTHISKFDQVRAVAEKFPNVFCSVGVHPHHSNEDSEQTTTAEIIEKSNHPKVIGIGEAGLDYFYDFSPKEKQKQVFRQHIEACLETGLPLIIHSRDAEDDTIDVIEETRAGAPLKALLHCFSSSHAMAMRALELGYSFSFSGIVTFPKSLEIQQTAKEIPLDRILVETDAPYLAPPPYRGKRNEPAYVLHVAEKIAELKGVTPPEIARATTDNFFRIFDKAVR